MSHHISILILVSPVVFPQPDCVIHGEPGLLITPAVPGLEAPGARLLVPHLALLRLLLTLLLRQQRLSPGVVVAQHQTLVTFVDY